MKNVWPKIKAVLAGAGWVIACILGFSALYNRSRYSGKPNTGIDTGQREIRSGIDRQGKSIDDSRERIEFIKKRLDHIGDTVGNNAERERTTQALVDESRILRERAKKYLDEHKD